MHDDALAVIARFSVHRRRHLSADGRLLTKVTALATDVATLVPLYRAMVLTRAFDLKAVSLQRRGPARHLCRVAGSGGGFGGCRQCHAPGGRASAVLPG